ncbi:GDP-mannose 4,6-dehydratase [Candidatus Binatia bacterium]|nr:GDP-mannose 4,6-dehydratase [Candidatus Binatia bacterium]
MSHADPYDPGAYAGRRALVTGAAGFVGSHLVERLLALGAEVFAFVRYTSHAALGARSGPLHELAPRLRGTLTGDLAASGAIDQIAALDIDVVFHLAADAWVTRSLTAPVDVFNNNVQSTLNVLEAVRRSGRNPRVVVTSSSEIYGTATTDRIAESHPLEPTSPYAASKVACDRLAIAWHRTFGTEVAIIRPFNTYGPRHVYDVIPLFIRAALRGEPLTIHGTGEQSRDFTYVTDMVEAFLTMGAHPEAVGRAVNFGTGNDVTIGTVARYVREITGCRSEIVHVDDRRAQVHRLCCDAALAQRLFGWRPAVGLRDGIERTAAWARGFERH